MFKNLGMWTWPDAVGSEDPTLMAERLGDARIGINLPYLCSRTDGQDKAAYELRLENLVDAAHRQGQMVYGCFDEMNAYEAMPAYPQRQAHKDGTLNQTLCPANPESIDYILGELGRFVSDFELDGINLEDGYVFHHATTYDPAHEADSQYSIEPVCYCDYCRAHAPIEKSDWAAWKQERLTDLIGAAAKLVRQLRPGMPFSAAARLPYSASFYSASQHEIPWYSGWKLCQSRDGFSADWVEWLRRGHVDFVCPMSYFHSDRVVELTITECQNQVSQSSNLVWMGLGLSEVNAEYHEGVVDEHDPTIKTYDPRLLNDAAAIERQMKLQLAMGQKNCLFFSYAFLRDAHIPIIADLARPLVPHAIGV